eukprot:RCo038918
MAKAVLTGECAPGLPSCESGQEVVEYARFLHQKVLDYEAERQELLNTMEVLRASDDETLKLRWVLRRKEDEIVELQQAAVQLKLRASVVEADVELLAEENARLREREAQDRQTIAELLQLCQPSSGPRESLTFIQPSSGPAAAVEPLPAPKLRSKRAAQRAEELLKQARARLQEGSNPPTTKSSEDPEEKWRLLLEQTTALHREELAQVSAERDSAVGYFQAKAQEEAQAVARARQTLSEVTRTLCLYRHRAEIEKRELSTELLHRGQELQKLQLRLEHELARRDATFAERLSQEKRDDQELIQLLRESAQKTDWAMTEAMEHATAVEQQAHQRVQRASAKLAQLQRRVQALSQFRYLGLRGCESELHLLTRRVELLERKVRAHLGLFAQRSPDSCSTLRALEDPTAPAVAAPPAVAERQAAATDRSGSAAAISAREHSAAAFSPSATQSRWHHRHHHHRHHTCRCAHRAVPATAVATAEVSVPAEEAVGSAGDVAAKKLRFRVPS